MVKSPKRARRDVADIKAIDDLNDKIQDLNQLLMEAESNIKGLVFYRDWWKEIARREREARLYAERQLAEEARNNEQA